ncbi:MAG: S9 family peptidase [Acidobacteria bacterium]|nr:S9 family peptidase [Acidobacteriota bacterium]
MMIKKYRLYIIALTFALILSACVSAQTLTVKEIMKEPSIAGNRAYGEQLSPDGKWVVFLWNKEGSSPGDLYLVSTTKGVPEKILSPSDLLTKTEETEKPDPLDYGVVVADDFSKARRNGIGNLRWSPDSSKLLLTQNGDIYILKIGENRPKRITKTQSFEFSAEFIDNDRILFQQNGNLFSLNLKDAALVQISTEDNSQKNKSVSGARLSKGGNMISYTVSDSSKQISLVVPNYLGYYTTAQQQRRGWTQQTVYAAKTDGSLDKSIEVELPKQEGEAYIAGTEWLSDEKTLIVDRIDNTHKRRQIFAATFSDGKSKVVLVHQETDDKWIGGPARILRANPKSNDQFFFSSEDGSGFNHLFTVKLDSSKFDATAANAEIRQVTKGNWEINWADWEMTGEYILYLSTKENTAERQFSSVKINTFDDTKTPFQPGKLPRADVYLGMKSNPQVNNGVMLYGYSEWNFPEELVVLWNIYDAKINYNADGFSSPITMTTPDSFRKRKWNEPKFISIAARDGEKIPAKVYFPENFDKAKKHPMVIFVHGAGYLQNVINGWNNYYREFMFNELLTQKGYVVLDIDYRGSAGYGRKFRTDVYDFLGGKDFDDHIDSIDYMVKNYNVDVSRIGAYGGSYGGFMAAMLVMRAPERIAAAAALRPVMDWKNYYATNPFYTSQRLRSPKENPEGYRRSSPISYAEKLEKPLLILHGLVDSNVHAQDSIQLVEKLIRLDKTQYFELMLYPAENHGFERSTSWEDEYERILALFEKNLK